MFRNFREKVRFLFRARKYRRRQEPDEISSLLLFTGPGDTVIDVGSHKGAYLYWMRKSVGPSGHIFAFEPQPELAQYLHQMTNLLKWHNVTIEQKGLSSEETELDLIIPLDSKSGSHSSPGASFVDHQYEGEHQITKVPVVTLDSYLKKQEHQVSFIKCDVEGHELAAFKGSEQTIQKDHPVLLFECEQRHLKEQQINSVFEWLNDRDYQGMFFSPTGLQSIEEFDPQVHQKVEEGRFWELPGYCNNFLFCPK